MDTLNLMDVTEEVTIQDNLSPNLQTVIHNTTSRDDCITVVFSEMEYLPWDNPDNIVSLEVETIVRRIKDNQLPIICLFGGLANVMNMAVFYRQGLHDRVNLCLFALSLADELTPLGPLVLHGEQLYLQFTTGERYGPVTTALVNWNLTVISGFYFISPVLSTIIATERCLCVFNPLKFQTLLRTKTMAVIIAVVYVVMIGLFFIVCFRYRISCMYDPTTGVVVTAGVEGKFYRAHKEFIDYLDSFTFGIGLPGIEMITVITTTVMTMVKLRQIVTWRSETSTRVSAREVALTKMLVGNSILFIACSTPIALSRFIRLFFPEMTVGGRQHNFYVSGLWVAEMFINFNATFNIFVYYAMGSRYRETFWALLGRNPEKS